MGPATWIFEENSALPSTRRRSIGDSTRGSLTMTVRMFLFISTPSTHPSFPFINRTFFSHLIRPCFLLSVRHSILPFFLFTYLLSPRSYFLSLFLPPFSHSLYLSILHPFPFFSCITRGSSVAEKKKKEMQANRCFFSFL